MAEPTLIQVILLPYGDQNSELSFRYSFEALEKWARENAVSVQEPVDRSEETLRFSTVLVRDRIRAESVSSQLAVQPFVDAAYIKPTDEAP